jgi:hypothetical protein
VNYFIKRDEQQYGPYTLSDLQRYVASGEVSLTDLAISDASAEPVPVAQIIGTIAVPPTGFTPAAPVSMAQTYPEAPNLHWGLVLLFTLLTCGIFIYVWDIVQAVWLKKIEPESKALYIYLGGDFVVLVIFAESFRAAFTHTTSPFVGLLQLVLAVVIIVGRFNFRHWMEKHYNEAEPMGLQLSGVMTFFFGTFYFQYHINDINSRKAADRLYEMSR